MRGTPLHSPVKIINLSSDSESETITLSSDGLNSSTEIVRRRSARLAARPKRLFVTPKVPRARKSKSIQKSAIWTLNNTNEKKSDTTPRKNSEVPRPTDVLRDEIHSVQSADSSISLLPSVEPRNTSQLLAPQIANHLSHSVRKRSKCLNQSSQQCSRLSGVLKYSDFVRSPSDQKKPLKRLPPFEITTQLNLDDTIQDIHEEVLIKVKEIIQSTRNSSISEVVLVTRDEMCNIIEKSCILCEIEPKKDIVQTCLSETYNVPWQQTLGITYEPRSKEPSLSLDTTFDTSEGLSGVTPMDDSSDESETSPLLRFRHHKHGYKFCNDRTCPDSFFSPDPKVNPKFKDVCRRPVKAALESVRKNVFPALPPRTVNEISQEMYNALAQAFQCDRKADVNIDSETDDA